MFDNLFEVTLLLMVGTLLGAGPVWLYYKGVVTKKEETIEDTQKSITQKTKQNNNLKNDLKNRNNEIGKLNTDLDNKNKAVTSLNTELEEKESNIATLTSRVSTLSNEVANNIQKISTLTNEAVDLTSQIEDGNQKISTLTNEAVDLTSQIEDGNQKISTLEDQLSNQIQLNIETTTRAENAETRSDNAETKNQTLEESITQKHQEIEQLKTNMKAMQHDFTVVEGIGKKVSTILRLANINTFTKLASTDTNTINSILEKSDPRILRLTDSTTWPEQAKLAAENKWDDLETLKASLKRGRKA